METLGQQAPRCARSAGACCVHAARVRRYPQHWIDRTLAVMPVTAIGRTGEVQIRLVYILITWVSREITASTRPVMMITGSQLNNRQHCNVQYNRADA